MKLDRTKASSRAGLRLLAGVTAHVLAGAAFAGVLVTRVANAGTALASMSATSVANG